MKTQKLILIVAFICISNLVFTQKIKAYLNQNKEVLNASEMEIVKSLENDTSQIILLGENHGFKEPQNIDYIFLKYLNKYKGFKYYLAEIDYFQAFYFNQYLENGNDSILMEIFNVWYDNSSQWANKDYFNKIKKIRNLNLSLPSEKKIQFIGADKIQSSHILKKYLLDLMQNSNYNHGENANLDTLIKLCEQKKKNLKEFIQFVPQLQNDIIKNPSVYEEVFRNKFFGFNYALRQIAVFKIPNRDSIIVENLKIIIKENKLEEEKFYGLWGYYHIYQNEINHGYGLAGLLKKYYSVSSIAIQSSKCKMMVPSQYLPKIAREKNSRYSYSKIPNNDGIMFSTKGIKSLKKISEKNTSVIYKLNGEGSPYTKGVSLVNISKLFGQGLKSTNKNTNTLDYFQYVILIKNSESVTPIISE